MDSAAYLFCQIAQITQLSSTSSTVITLGQLSNVPLMCSASELSYGSEPHALFTPGHGTDGSVQTGHRVQDGVYPGLRQWVGTGRGYTGYYPPVIHGRFDAYFMEYLRLIGSYCRLTRNI